MKPPSSLAHPCFRIIVIGALVSAASIACLGESKRKSSLAGATQVQPAERFLELVRAERSATYVVRYESNDGDWDLRRSRSRDGLRWDQAYYDSASVAGSSTVTGSSNGTCGWSLYDTSSSVVVACRSAGTEWTDAFENLFEFTAEFADSIVEYSQMTLAEKEAECFEAEGLFGGRACFTSSGVPMLFETANTVGAVYVAVAREVILDTEFPPVVAGGYNSRFEPRPFEFAEVTLPAFPRLREAINSWRITIRLE